MLNLFKTKHIKARAEELAQLLARDLPPSTFTDKKKVQSVNKISSTLERTYSAALNFKEAEKMGMYKRSIFANAFRWKLEELGFPKDFVSVAVEGLIVEISGIKKKTGK